ncbi:MAG: DUF1080 domain-containing protein [Prevotellaceae bacterium]|jgi:hypothetical protein|nr:DUF1080 domain-containing protein [Prevotellaceae bacterium]
MKKNIFTAKALAVAIICSCSANLEAQKKYPEPEPMKAGMSEFWTPQPKIVTPGTATDNAIISPPSDAIVLFDGKDLSAWKSSKNDEDEPKWIVKDGVIVATPTGSIETRQHFENFQLHIEWRISENVKGSGQGRGNSGVFMQSKYELQILDSYQSETYANGQAGSIYKQSPPLVNAMRKPGEWNVYDVIYSAPIFKKDGTYRIPPRITVLHNGVVIQNNTTIVGTTEYIGFPKVIEHGAGPVRLQDHGDAVCFRNIWIREL